VVVMAGKVAGTVTDVGLELCRCDRDRINAVYDVVIAGGKHPLCSVATMTTTLGRTR